MKSFLSILFTILIMKAGAQSKVNYDESKVEPYTLPELLRSAGGQEIKTVKEWESIRRTEIVRLFEEEVYGKIPAEAQLKPTIEILEKEGEAFHGKAVRQQIALDFERNGQSLRVHLLVYLPAGQDNPPVFVGYNFYGNASITEDENILLSPSWVPNKKEFGITENQITDGARGQRAHRWPVEKIIDAGFGLAAIYYGDVDPDRDDFSDGIHPLFYEEGQTKPGPSEWGAISAWAWGASRALDYLKSEPATANSKYILFGHSRLGKTSLWGGALDKRWDLVIANNSGCGGVAISRRKIGETVEAINTSFPHWFADRFKKYNDQENKMPVDQHMLVALIAPRPVYISSAVEDRWADPVGEYLGAYYASPAYQLYGLETPASDQQPSVSKPIHTSIGYHLRPGGHDVTDYDWEQFIAFSRKHLKP
ncbi:glucuronyl esterase domain-containing protein [Jiulongibacter sediminis]|uniref:Acetyl xylan esterase n=1 Tax=Jiulongibacter sediminis TaxID=1605367 RepID=A0A0N8HAA6_9BACT|nr:acetylxylan esterase [Jiulongibacter sediminis]KPM49636.1 acetyl xylan esterase [Jiulongibacter sediminis]TBX26674.1 acetyl xylan esterase [Jiulongibacter sediminis]